MAGRVVVISGGSLSGKSTLSRALLERLGPNWLLIEADAYAPAMSGSGDWTPESLRRFTLDLHRSASEWAARGYNVILDGILPYPEDDLLDACLALLAPLEPVFVGVSASADTIRARAIKRADADVEWALRQSRDANARVPLAVDVCNADAEEQRASIEAILEALASPIRK